MRRTRQTALVIEEDRSDRKVIREALTDRGITVHADCHSKGGLGAFLQIKPDIVILSVSPCANSGAQALTDICEADPQARVIAVSDSSDSAFAMECIRHGACDFLRKPLSAHDLLLSIDRINNRSNLRRKITEPDIECVKTEDKTLLFGNDLGSLPCIMNQAVLNAPAVCPNVPMLKTALSEVVLNAIEHGNLNIGREEKADAMAKDNYRDLLDERMNDPRYAGRMVSLQVQMTASKLVYTVTDEGDGFDYRSVFSSDPTSHAGSGLGLFVARSFFTRITFKGRGNRVVLVYRRSAEVARESLHAVS